MYPPVGSTLSGAPVGIAVVGHVERLHHRIVDSPVYTATHTAVVSLIVLYTHCGKLSHRLALLVEHASAEDGALEALGVPLTPPFGRSFESTLQFDAASK